MIAILIPEVRRCAELEHMQPASVQVEEGSETEREPSRMPVNVRDKLLKQGKGV
jgi:hypothetical protein